MLEFNFLLKPSALRYHFVWIEVEYECDPSTRLGAYRAGYDCDYLCHPDNGVVREKIKSKCFSNLASWDWDGVCGAAAIAAVSPILKAKEEDTAMGVGIIALVGTIFSIIYTILQPFLPLSASEYGIWSGLSLHELAHAALAGAAAGPDGLRLRAAGKVRPSIAARAALFDSRLLDEKERHLFRRGSKN